MDRQEGKREEAHDLLDAHRPLLCYEQQPGAGLAVRKYVLMRRGHLAVGGATQALRRADSHGEEQGKQSNGQTGAC